VSNSTDVPAGLKRCSRCRENKPFESFSPWKRAKDGRYNYCRPCAADIARIANADPEVRARKAAYQRARRSNPAKAQADRETSAQWKISNPERARAHNSTPSKVANNAAWNAANREKRLGYVRAYQERNPEIGKVAQQRRRARKLDTDDSLTHAQWLTILDEFRHSCAYCLRSEIPMQQEHMTPLARGGKHDRFNVIPSCGPCNYKKHTRDLLEFLAVGGKA